VAKTGVSMPVTDDRTNEDDAHLIDVLAHGRAEILATYEERLRAADSHLVASPMAREQCLMHADLMIQDVLHELSLEGGSPGGRSPSLPWEIGIARAAEEVHPRESLDAIVILFELIVRRAADHLDDRPRAGAGMFEVTTALNRSMIRRISEASSAYTGFLLNRVHRAQLEERQRIAREMHDRLGHALGVALRNVEFILYLVGDSPEAVRRLLVARDSIRESIQTIRAITSDLRLTEPVRGLEVMLSGFLANANAGHVRTHLVINGDGSWCRPEVIEEVFLVIREAAHNAFTHAGPERIMVRVNISPAHLHAVVDDDGAGFEVPPTIGKSTGGLSGMHHRIRALGGTLTVTSRPGHGTRVEFDIPLIQPPAASPRELTQQGTDVPDPDRSTAKGEDDRS
jgi:signal transduction histidine kinase